MLLLFAHGAGLPSTSPWMERWATALGEFGTVVRFDYPYMAAGKRMPDRLPILLEAHKTALQDARRAHPHLDRVVLIGKSMGSRVGCHVALEVPVDAVVCLGYPLASMGNRDKLRDAVLLAQDQPVAFVQGTRDKLCPLDLLDTVRAKMTAPHVVHIVDTGDHSLQITKTHTKKTQLSQEDSDASAIAALREFLRDLPATTP